MAIGKLLICALTLAVSEASVVDEASTLIQSAVRTHSAEDGAEAEQADDDSNDDKAEDEAKEEDEDDDEVVIETKAAPVVYTELGPIKGAHEKGYDVFKNIPYAEPVKRFMPPVPKESWGTKPLLADKFGAACIGAGIGGPEAEDCLKLHIWRPAGKSTNLPVIVYFHGGMNQHGSGMEETRQGDGIVQSAGHPVIFVGLDFRLGIFGWIDAGNSGNSSIFQRNLGLLDQQEALKFVKKHIGAFGGDPARVTLQGQSEGAHNILAHLVSPGSAGLFGRVVLHSPAADIWSRKTNMERTREIALRAGCMGILTISCLQTTPAEKLSDADWQADDMDGSRGPEKQAHALMAYQKFSAGANKTVPGYLGWSPVIDGVVLPGEVRELIPQGRWNKVPVLITTTMNESTGIYSSAGNTYSKLTNGLTTLVGASELYNMRMVYNLSLASSGVIVHDDVRLMHMMVTDKMWTCDIRALAQDILKGGGEAFLSMFAHRPMYDPDGAKKNELCELGAACHASDMLYVLPQGRDAGIHGEGTEEDVAFSQRYSEDVLTFVYGGEGPWVPYNQSKSWTFYETEGPRVVPGYRNSQCEWLDASVGESLPQVMKNSGFGNWINLHIGKRLRQIPDRSQEYIDAYHKKYGHSHKPAVVEAIANEVKELKNKVVGAVGVASVMGEKLAESTAKVALNSMFPY